MPSTSKFVNQSTGPMDPWQPLDATELAQVDGGFVFGVAAVVGGILGRLAAGATSGGGSIDPRLIEFAKNPKNGPTIQ
jgi:hypothetical protein